MLMKILKKSKCILLIVALGIIILFISCGNSEPPEIKNNHYTLISLDYNELYYTYLPVYYDIYGPFDYIAD